MRTKVLYNSAFSYNTMSVVLKHSSFPDPLGVRYMNEKIVSLTMQAKRKGYETPGEIIDFINHNTSYKVTVPKDFEKAYL